MTREKLTSSESERLSLLARRYFGVSYANVYSYDELWVGGGWVSKGARERFHAWVARQEPEQANSVNVDASTDQTGQ